MKPLEGRTILVTRAREQAGSLAQALAERGARVIEAPVIAFEEPEDWSLADAAIRRYASYDIAVFTSANAVDRFAARRERLGLSAPASGPPRTIAIGPATARALQRRGMGARDVAPASSAEGVLELLSGQPLAGRKVLIPRAEVAREILPDGLRALGAQVDVVTVYRTVAVPLTPEVARLIARRAVDVVTFTSASTVTHLLAAVGGPGALSGIEIAVIGPVTRRAAAEAGLVPTIVPAGAGMEDLAESIAARYAPTS